METTTATLHEVGLSITVSRIWGCSCVQNGQPLVQKLGERFDDYHAYRPGSEFGIMGSVGKSNWRVVFALDGENVTISTLTMQQAAGAVVQADQDGLDPNN